jgi:hypothetical protein
MRKAERIRVYFSKPKGVREQKSFGNTALGHTCVVVFHKCTTMLLLLSVDGRKTPSHIKIRT